MKINRKAWAARTVLRSLAATWRFRDEVQSDCRAVLDGRQIAVIAYWHCRMMPLWFRMRHLHASALVSPSSDGEVLTRYLASLGYQNILRGSSSSRGSEALSQSVQQLAARSLLITPDGPRGPARRAKPGAILAALRADVPLVVAGWECGSALRFGSWDRLSVPVPFATIHCRYARFDLSGLTVDSRITEEVLSRFAAAIDGVSGDEPA